MDTHAKLALYVLKKAQGVPLSVYREQEITIIQTGARTTLQVDYPIQQVLITSKTFSLHYKYGLSFVAANKNFAYGGYFNLENRAVVIDKDDLDIDLKLTDFIFYNNVKYGIESIEDVDDINCYVVTVKGLANAPKQRVVRAYTEDALEFIDDCEPA